MYIESTKNRANHLTSLKLYFGYSFIINLSLLCLSLSAVHARAKVIGFQEQGENLNFKALIPHLVSNENYVEKYTFDAEIQSEDGQKGQLYFSASINNLGAGDHKLHLKGRLSLGDEKFTWNRKFAAGKWKNNKAKLSISAGGISLSSVNDQQLNFKVKTKAQSFDLLFTPQVKAWRPKNGGLEFQGSSKKAEFALFPMARVSGTWLQQSQKKLTLHGQAWGRHSWSHLGPHEWIRWSQLVRVFDPMHGQSAFIRRIQLGGDYQDKILSYAIVSSDKKIIFEGYNLEANETRHWTDKKHENKYRFPTQMTLKSKAVDGQSQLTFKLSTNKRISRRNPIAHLSWAKRKLAEMFSKPMKYAYAFDYDLSITGARTIQMKGSTGRYEIFHLN